MNVSVPQKRTRALLACVCATLFAGCAASRSGSGTAEGDRTAALTEEAGTTGVGLPGETAAPAPAETTPAVTTRQLFSSPVDGLDVALTGDAASGELTVARPDGTPVTYKAMELSSPRRLVLDLDLPSASIPGARRTKTADSALLSGARLAPHAKKGRLVLDLPEDRDLTTSVRSDEGRVVVSLSRPGASAPVVAADEGSGSRDLAAEPTMTSLSIEGAGDDGNLVVASVTSPAEYSLRQTAPSEYVLRLRGTVLGAAASPVISEKSDGAIRSARPVAEGEDTLVRIFARPEASLVAAAEEGKVIVRSATDDLRAQMTPETEGSVAADKPAATPEPTPAAKKEVKGSEDDKAEKSPEPVVQVSAGGDDASRFLDESPRYSGRLISLDLQDTDIDNALRIIAEVSNLNIIASDDVAGKVTLRLIDVPWDQALDVILKTNGLDKVQEGNVIRIAPVEKLRTEREALKQAQQAEEELEPVQVKYIRVSYAKAAELKPLIDNVISERGAATFDERTNQVIVKDIARGVKNVSQLISKLDLRTPQVLLETQIVEANRSILRDLGNEFGFRFVQSPATGNATSNNFPNSVDTSGNIAFPAQAGSSPITLLLGSADGAISISDRITALESESRVRVVSRPAVATTNNKEAVIKSVQKVRVKLPSSGVSVATGQGATAAGQGSLATETIEIGIILTVTPQASPDYYVLLDINAKSSTLGPVLGNDGIPSEIERSATSSVLVSSGQTFALGGIYKISDNDDVAGLPFLKDVPFIGHLFRRTQVRNGDEELLFFLTPRIVEGSFDDGAMKQSS